MRVWLMNYWRSRFLFCVWLVMLLTAIPAVARDFKYRHGDNELTYTVVDGDRHFCAVKGVSKDSTVNEVAGYVEIPDKAYDGDAAYTVVMIQPYAFCGQTAMRGVSIPPSIYHIGWWAFSGCNLSEGVEFWSLESLLNMEFEDSGSNPMSRSSKVLVGGEVLEEVVIPEMVKEIKDYTFYNCVTLRSITFSDSVTKIGETAFAWCENLSGITIPNSVTSIGDGAFYKCIRLKEIVIPDSVTSIGRGTFKECTNLSRIDLGNGIESIGDEAFYGCKNIREVIIPESVESIGASVFTNCILDYVYMPSSVKSIGSDAFWSISLRTMEVEDIRALCELNLSPGGDGPLVKVEKLLMNGEEVHDLVIPEGVENIGNVFRQFNGLTSVVIPSSVTRIRNPFYKCQNLRYIELLGDVPPKIEHDYEGYLLEEFPGTNESLTLYVPETALAAVYESGWSKYNIVSSTTGRKHTIFESDGLNYLILDDGSVSLVKGEYSSLSSVVIPREVTYGGSSYAVRSIGYSAFEDCPSLKEVFIPQSVNSIGDRAFLRCKLEQINIPSSVRQIGNNAFYYSSMPEGEGVAEFDSLESLLAIKFANIYSSPLSGSLRLMVGGKLISELVIPDGVSVISAYSFVGCRGLKSVSMPYSVTEVGDRAFSSCRDLVRVEMSDNIKTVGKNAFVACFALKTLDWSDSLESIGESAFYNCTSLQTLELPLSLKFINKQAFYGCKSLTDVRLPESLSTIGERAFEKCSALAGIVIPNSVSSIGEYAFRDCVAMASLTLGSGIKSIEREAFVNCSIEEVVLPPGVEYLGYSPFATSLGLKKISYGYTPLDINQDNIANLSELNITASDKLSDYSDLWAISQRFPKDCVVNVMPEYMDNYMLWRYAGIEVNKLNPIRRIAIDGAEDVTLEPGETISLNASLLPQDASLPYVFWKSTNPEIAYVDNFGNVTALEPAINHSGTSEYEALSTPECMIIAETLYEGVYASVTVHNTGFNGLRNLDCSSCCHMTGDIFNMQGICVKRNSSEEDIRCLPAGIYIIGGKKIVKK